MKRAIALEYVWPPVAGLFAVVARAQGKMSITVPRFTME